MNEKISTEKKLFLMALGIGVLVVPVFLWFFYSILVEPLFRVAKTNQGKNTETVNRASSSAVPWLEQIKKEATRAIEKGSNK